MAFTALRFNTNALYQGVTQLAHGFTDVGTMLRFDGVNFVEADASTEANAEIVGMISGIQDVNSFYITQTGFVSGLTTTPTEGGAYIPGTLYYLSQTPGELTSIKPTTVGQVELPCFIAYTATSGFVFSNVGTLVESGSLFNWNTVASDTNMVSNNGYILASFVTRDFLLPPSLNSAVGDVLKVLIFPSLPVSVRITQNANQMITLADRTTTNGVAGRLELLPTSGTLLGTLDMVCVSASVPSTQWVVMAGTGSWDVV